VAKRKANRRLAPARCGRIRESQRGRNDTVVPPRGGLRHEGAATFRSVATEAPPGGTGYSGPVPTIAFDSADAALVFAIFVLGGLVKGVAGFGLPTVALGLLALTRPLPEAIPLILLPTLATNIWQALASGALRPTLRRLWGFVLAAAIGTFLAAGQLARTDAAVLAGLLGLLMTASAALALLGPRWPQPSARAEAWLSPLMGGASGAVAGLTGSFIMPATPYLAALRLPPDAFVQAFALGAVVATLALGLSMAGQGLLPPELGLAGVLVMVPAFLGMGLGRVARGRMSEREFRRVVQMLLLLLGLYLAGRNLLG
jgi:uncharacterized protein